MKFLNVSLLILFFCNVSYAQQQVLNFDLDTKFVSNGVEFPLKISSISNLDLGQFLLRPVSSRGVIEIFNPSMDMWINGNETWSVLPPMTSRMKLRLRMFSAPFADVGFVINDTVKNKVYYTNPMLLINNSIYSNYVITANYADNVLSTPQVFEETTSKGNVDTGILDFTSKAHNRNFKISLILLMSAFTVLSLFYKIKKSTG